ncbi:hypothetical protein PGT21_020247 [Puccinia graminis f. sp. tritici]|uniref:Uncharacterized protein n=1 Tax=Puccinia graminis f. sp. tritici TaxID=56615 RepID=A0A5B0N0Z8_PUCGR|nr:hypothetical protein PGT21_020247 [Puccinia graminis f. sp. tritici]KAA1124145.1 hypothetical protein PGTUg99_029981 [Puccinia graminis f. sp. tritici]
MQNSIQSSKCDLHEEANHFIPPFFDAYDWDFLRYQGSKDVFSDLNRPQFSHDFSLKEMLENLNFQKSGDFYFIPTSKMPDVVQKYTKKKHQFRRKIKTSLRPKILCEIVLKISNEKLDLDKYSTFSNGLMRNLRLSIESRNNMNRLKKERSVSGSKISSITNFVSNITKISTFLIIVRLSLLKEHKEGKLNNKIVEGILSFMKKFWDELMENGDGKLTNKFDWAKNISALLHLQKIDKDHNKTRINERAKWYHISNNLVEYWAQENKRAGYKFTSLEQNNRQQLIEIINTMIIHSNPNLVLKYNSLWDKKSNYFQSDLVEPSTKIRSIPTQPVD